MALRDNPSTNDSPGDSGSTGTPTEQATTREAKRASHLPSIRSLYSGFIHVVVGPERQDFGVHKGLMCYFSKYFQAAFNGSYDEGVSGIIELPEEKPATFDIVYAWLYSQKLTQVDNGEDVTCNLTQISQVFVFADKYDMPALCNGALDEIIRLYEVCNKVSPDLAYIYENTPRGSPLRKVVLATYTAQPRHLNEVLENQEIEALFLTCPEFLLDVSKLLSSSLGAIPQMKPLPQGKARHIEDPCQYHRHAQGEADWSSTRLPLQSPSSRHVKGDGRQDVAQ